MFTEMQAKFPGKCRVCNEPIAIGADILLGPKNGYRRWVAHIECARLRQKQKALEGIPQNLHKLILDYGQVGKPYVNPGKAPTYRQLKTICGYTKRKDWHDLGLCHGECSDIIETYNFLSRQRKRDANLKAQPAKVIRQLDESLLSLDRAKQEHGDNWVYYWTWNTGLCKTMPRIKELQKVYDELNTINEQRETYDYYLNRIKQADTENLIGFVLKDLKGRTSLDPDKAKELTERTWAKLAAIQAAMDAAA